LVAPCLAKKIAICIQKIRDYSIDKFAMRFFLKKRYIPLSQSLTGQVQVRQPAPSVQRLSGHHEGVQEPEHRHTRGHRSGLQSLPRPPGINCRLQHLPAAGIQNRSSQQRFGKIASFKLKLTIAYQL